MAINFNHTTNTISYTQTGGGSQTGCFITTSQTGCFVTTGQTGIFVASTELQNYTLNCNTGSFVTSSQTGVFALSANTGKFASKNDYGHLLTSQIPEIYGDVRIVGGNNISTVTGIQGYPISNAAPVMGQTLQFDGTYWQPGAIPAGGNGGGGLVYYFNQSVAPDQPVSGITTGQFGVKELGRVASTGQTSITADLVKDTEIRIISFVTDEFDPDITAIPGGLFDLNIWMSSNATTALQVALIIKVYKYNGGAGTAQILATSDLVHVYDPTVTSQYIMSIVLPQLEVTTSDRLLLELNAISYANNKTLTIKFGGETPSHVHTTIPSIGGSGLVKVINGIMQNPASKLVDADIDPSAQICSNKIQSGVFALACNTGNFLTNSQTSKFALNSQVMHRYVDTYAAGNIMGTFGAGFPISTIINCNVITPVNTGVLASLITGSPITTANLTNAFICSIDLVAGNFCVTTNASSTLNTNATRYGSTPNTLRSFIGPKCYDGINSYSGLSIVALQQTTSSYNGPWIVCQAANTEATGVNFSISSGSNIVTINSIPSGSITANGTRELGVSQVTYGYLVCPINAFNNTGTGTYLLNNISPIAVTSTNSCVGLSEILTRPDWFTGCVQNGILTSLTRNASNGVTYSNVGLNNTVSTGINVGYDTITVSRIYAKGDSPTLAGNTFTAGQTFPSNTTAGTFPFAFQPGSLNTTPIIHRVEWDGQYMYTNSSKNELVATGTTAGTITSIVVRNSDDSTNTTITSGTITIAAGATTTGIASQIASNINTFYSANGGSSFWTGFLSGSTVYLSTPISGKMIGASPTLAGTAINNIQTPINRRRVLVLEEQNVAPLSSSFPGNKGAIYADPNFLYFCVEKNTWRRVGLTSF